MRKVSYGGFVRIHASGSEKARNSRFEAPGVGKGKREPMTKRALLVGINNYANAPLRGCLNDVTDLAQLLTQRHGFQDTEIRTLLDEQATAANIRSALKGWLLQSASSGARLLFHFSGHGSLLPYADGNVHNIVCPYDCDFTDQRSLSDIDFRRIFGAVPQGAIFNWISDSCHSGNLAKSIKRTLKRAFGMRNAVPRYLPPPPQIMQQIRKMSKRAATKSLSDAVDQLNGVLIAGCDSHEESADAVFNDRFNGALTYFLLKRLNGERGLVEDVDTIIKEVARMVRENGYDQHPQIRGLPTLRKKPFLTAGPSA